MDGRIWFGSETYKPGEKFHLKTTFDGAKEYFHDYVQHHEFPKKISQFGTVVWTSIANWDNIFYMSKELKYVDYNIMISEVYIKPKSVLFELNPSLKKHKFVTLVRSHRSKLMYG